MKKQALAVLLISTLALSMAPAELGAEPVLHKVDGRYVDTADTPMEVSDHLKEHWEEGTYDEGGSDYQTKRIVLESSTNLADSYGASDAIYDADHGQYVLEYDTEKETKQAYQKLSKEYGDSNVCLDALVHLESVSWGTQMMELDSLMNYAATDSSLSGRTVTVAVIDTGINSSHEMFSGRISSKSTSVIDSSYEDEQGHGTHVSGIICDGTPSNVKIMAVKAMDANGEGTVLWIEQALEYASSNGANIINMSLGLDGFSRSEYGTIYDDFENILKSAYNRGIVSLAASGNGDEASNYQGRDMGVANSYPAMSDYTLAVGSLNSSKVRSSFSYYGSKLDFIAPGENILSAYKGGSDAYAYSSGTSMATPSLAAVVAMIKLYHPSYTPAQIKQVLVREAIDLGASGKDVYYGYGLVAIGTPGETELSAVDLAKTAIPKAVIRKKTRKKKGFKIAWAPKSTADGYQIRYSTKKSMKGAKTKTITGSSKSSKTVKKLKKKKKYYVQVRCYKYINGVKKYGAWSVKVNIKTK